MSQIVWIVGNAYAIFRHEIGLKPSLESCYKAASVKESIAYLPFGLLIAIVLMDSGWQLFCPQLPAHSPTSTTRSYFVFRWNTRSLLRRWQPETFGAHAQLTALVTSLMPLVVLKLMTSDMVGMQACIPGHGCFWWKKTVHIIKWMLKISLKFWKKLLANFIRL